MAMNRVQFQQGLRMAQFMAQDGPEAKCRRALFRSRWPKGYRCPAGVRRSVVVMIPVRWPDLLSVQGVPHQTTLLSRTVFEATKLPLTTWFLAIHLLTSTKTNMAALELKRHLGGELPHGVAPEAQGDGGDDAARRTAPTKLLCAD